jgi:hypothetical protein
MRAHIGTWGRRANVANGSKTVGVQRASAWHCRWAMRSTPFDSRPHGDAVMPSVARLLSNRTTTTRENARTNLTPRKIAGTRR